MWNSIDIQTKIVLFVLLPSFVASVILIAYLRNDTYEYIKDKIDKWKKKK